MGFVVAHLFANEGGNMSRRQVWALVVGLIVITTSLAAYAHVGNHAHLGFTHFMQEHFLSGVLVVATIGLFVWLALKLTKSAGTK